MTAKEQLLELAKHITDEQAEKLVQTYYIYFDDDIIDENGNVVVDEFYSHLLNDIDKEDTTSYSQEEVKQILGLK